MLGLKKFRSQIVDHKRINEILKNIKKKSIRERVDAKNNIQNMEINDLELC